MINNDKIIIIGCSAGGLKVLLAILAPLPANFPFAIIIVQHISRDGEVLLMDVLSSSLKLFVKEAIPEEKPEPGNIYVAPGDYHLLFEKNGTFNLSLDEKVIGSRPSIDVIFETAAEAFKSNMVAIILTGNSADGATGIKRAHDSGATIIIQNPKSAEYPTMPEAAMAIIGNQSSYNPDQIGQQLLKMG